MKVAIKVLLCSALVAGSCISQSDHQKGSLTEDGLLGGVDRPVCEAKNGPENSIRLYQHAHDAKDTSQISTADTSKKCGAASPETSSWMTGPFNGQSVFVSKTNDIFNNILTEVKVLMEHAKMALLNLKTELSLGPLKNEYYKDNADVTSESLEITQTEIHSFVNRFPSLVQAVVDEPSQIWTVQDIFTASVPVDQISQSVGRLRAHILELLRVIQRSLSNNPAALSRIQSVQEYIASLQIGEFEILDDLVIRENLDTHYSSSRPSAPSNTYPSESSGTSDTSILLSDADKSDTILMKQFKTLRALCSTIRIIPDILIDLLTAVKEALSSLHTNGGLSEEIKKHPIFSIPSFNHLLPEEQNMDKTDSISVSIDWPSANNERGPKVPPTLTSSATSVGSLSSSGSGSSYRPEIDILIRTDSGHSLTLPQNQGSTVTSSESSGSSAASLSSACDSKTVIELRPSSSGAPTDSSLVQSSPNAAHFTIVPWIQSSTDSTSPSHLSGFNDGLGPGGAVRSSVGVASTLMRTLPDRAPSVISPWTEGSTDSISSLSTPISSFSFYGSGQGIRPEAQAISSATGTGFSIAQRIPDPRYSVIPHWDQGYRAVASSASNSISTSALSNLNYENRPLTGGISSVMGTASPVPQIAPEKAHSVIFPELHGSTRFTLSAPSSVSSSDFSRFDNEDDPRGGAINSAPATALSTPRTIVDKVLSASSPYFQHSVESRPSALNPVSSSGSHNSNYEIRSGTPGFSSTLDKASAIAQTVPDTARSVISPWLQGSYGSDYGIRSGTQGFSSTLDKASAIAQTVPDTARAVISPWLQGSRASASSTSSSASSFGTTNLDYGNRQGPGTISAAIATASAVAQTLPDQVRSVISPSIQGSMNSPKSAPNSGRSPAFPDFDNGDRSGTKAISSVITTTSSITQAMPGHSTDSTSPASSPAVPDTVRSVISPRIQNSGIYTSSIYSDTAPSSGVESSTDEDRRAASSAIAQGFYGTAASRVSPRLQKTHRSGSAPASTSSSFSNSNARPNSKEFSPTIVRQPSAPQTSMPSPWRDVTTGPTSSGPNSAGSFTAYNRDEAQSQRYPHRKSGSKCKLFSCLHRHKGHDQHADSASTIDSNDSYLARTPSTSYTFSSASFPSSGPLDLSNESAFGKFSPVSATDTASEESLVDTNEMIPSSIRNSMGTSPAFADATSRLNSQSKLSSSAHNHQMKPQGDQSFRRKNKGHHSHHSVNTLREILSNIASRSDNPAYMAYPNNIDQSHPYRSSQQDISNSIFNSRSFGSTLPNANPQIRNPYIANFPSANKNSARHFWSSEISPTASTSPFAMSADFDWDSSSSFFTPPRTFPSGRNPSIFPYISNLSPINSDSSNSPRLSSSNEKSFFSFYNFKPSQSTFSHLFELPLKSFPQPAYQDDHEDSPLIVDYSSGGPRRSSFPFRSLPSHSKLCTCSPPFSSPPKVKSTIAEPELALSDMIVIDLAK